MCFKSCCIIKKHHCLLGTEEMANMLQAKIADLESLMTKNRCVNFTIHLLCLKAWTVKKSGNFWNFIKSVKLLVKVSTYHLIGEIGYSRTTYTEKPTETDPATFADCLSEIEDMIALTTKFYSDLGKMVEAMQKNALQAASLSLSSLQLNEATGR